MKLSDIMAAAGQAAWAEIALVICFACFVLILLYLFVLRPARSWERQRHLPLDNAGAGSTHADREEEDKS